MPLYHPIPRYLEREVALISRNWEIIAADTQRLLDYFTTRYPDEQKATFLREVQEVNHALEGGLLLGYSYPSWHDWPKSEHYLLKRIMVHADDPLPPPQRLYNPWTYSYELGRHKDVVLDQYGLRRKLVWPSREDFIWKHVLRQVRQGHHDHWWYYRSLGWLHRSYDYCVYCLAVQDSEGIQEVQCH